MYKYQWIYTTSGFDVLNTKSIERFSIVQRKRLDGEPPMWELIAHMWSGNFYTVADSEDYEKIVEALYEITDGHKLGEN